MSQPKSVLEQILEELRLSRKEQNEKLDAVYDELRSQRQLLKRLAGEVEEVEQEVEEIEQDLQPMAMSLTYDLSTVPFSAASNITYPQRR